MTMNPKVAILLATYNGEKYICEQLDSLLNQNIHGGDTSKPSKRKKKVRKSRAQISKEVLRRYRISRYIYMTMDRATIRSPSFKTM